MKRILAIALMAITLLLAAALGQTARRQTNQRSHSKAANANGKILTSQTNGPAPQPLRPPLVDHHMHIWSLNASAFVTEPLPPTVELPAELAQLLRDKEKWGGKDKNPKALADLYTEDLLVLDPTVNSWLRGPRALKYIVESTEINRLQPTAYALNGSAGYVAGTEVTGEGSSTRYLSSFLYVLRKGADGKWRIAAENFTMQGPPMPQAAAPEPLIREMDAAGVRRAAVLSVAYWFGNPRRQAGTDEYAKVRAENDWVSQQVARYPDRLVGFCSFNPLKDYALEELERCAKDAHFKGLKLHFGNSMVDVLNPQHVEKVRQVFRAANERRLPIIVHLWTSTGNYGRPHAESFLKQILPAAPDIPIQIAHLSASGPGYHSDDALEVYANAAVAGDARMKNVYFDVAGMVLKDTPLDTLALVAKRLRQLGMKRILFGSDYAPGGHNVAPKDAWEAFRRLPLNDEEFRLIAENVAPYMR